LSKFTKFILFLLKFVLICYTVLSGSFLFLGFPLACCPVRDSFPLRFLSKSEVGVRRCPPGHHIPMIPLPPVTIYRRPPHRSPYTGDPPLVAIYRWPPWSLYVWTVPGPARPPSHGPPGGVPRLDDCQTAHLRHILRHSVAIVYKRREKTPQFTWRLVVEENGLKQCIAVY